MKPENVQTGLVTGRFIAGIIDGPDEDDEPDFIAAVGRIMFVASVDYLPNPTAAEGPVTILQPPITGILDHEGFLCTPNAAGGPGARGVRLIATDDPDILVQDWTWNAAYSFEKVNGIETKIAPHGFYLPAGDLPADLTTLIKVPSSPGIGFEQMEAAVLRAEAEAAAAAQTVLESAAVVQQTFVGAQVQGDALMLTRENGDTINAGDVRGLPGPAGPNTVPTVEAVAAAIGTEESVARTAVQEVVDGRKVGTPNLLDEAVSGPKLAGGSVSPSKLSIELVEQLSGYEQEILLRPTSTVVQAKTMQARESRAVITYGTFGSPSVTYEKITVVGALHTPGLVGKRFGLDYELQGTTGDNFKPTLESPISLYQRTGADLVINAGGVVFTSGDPREGQMDGAQIKDGIAYRDFNPPGWGRGTDGIGFKADGSAKVYSSNWGDSAASMIADGVINSFSFGPAYMVDGVKQAVTGTAISARQILGTTAAGDLVIISTSGVSDFSGITYPQAANLAQDQGLINAVALDGGGSVQTLAAGQWVHPTSDAAAPRTVADFLLINTRIVGDIGTSWFALAPMNGFTGSNSPAVRLKNGQASCRGALTHATATAATIAAKVPWWAQPDGYQRFAATINLTAGQFYDVDAAGQIIMTSSIANGGPRYLSTIKYPAKL